MEGNRWVVLHVEEICALEMPGKLLLVGGERRGLNLDVHGATCHVISNQFDRTREFSERSVVLASHLGTNEANARPLLREDVSHGLAAGGGNLGRLTHGCYRLIFYRIVIATKAQTQSEEGRAELNLRPNGVRRNVHGRNLEPRGSLTSPPNERVTDVGARIPDDNW